MDFQAYNSSPNTDCSQPHINAMQTNGLPYREISRSARPEVDPVAPETAMMVHSLGTLVQHGVSPSQLSCLFCEVAQQAYFQVRKDLQGHHGWKSLREAIQVLTLHSTGRPQNLISANHTSSSVPPSSFQQCHDLRWSTLTGETLLGSRDIGDSSYKALHIPSALGEDLYRDPSQFNHSTKLDSPFAVSSPATFEVPDTTDFNFEFALSSDEPVIPSVEGDAGFYPYDGTIHIDGFAGTEYPPSPQSQSRLHTVVHHAHSATTTPSQLETPGSSTVGHQNFSTKMSTRKPVLPCKDFIDYTPPAPTEPCYRSPCPYCSKNFKAQKEFVSHMTAEHDRPTQYRCLHAAQGQSRCCFTTCRLSRFNKHHTEHHGEHCNMAHKDKQIASPCRSEQSNPRPKRVWGCWMCKHASYSVKAWVKHQMEEHDKFTRKQIKWTWLVRSLLSQDMAEFLWQHQVAQLEETTGYRWMIEWSEGADESTRDRLIRNLETGSFESRSFESDPSACQSIVMAAMDATFGFKSELEPIMAGTNSSKRPSTSSPPHCDGTRYSGPRLLRRQKSFASSKYHPVNATVLAKQPARPSTSNPRNVD
ncbi:hypothetical protein LTR70_005447 [Exophiala xenobiotica]|uniref:C2H2-type domain-containing protein n=1 Tax=Lithohypha guttulata TaxID=1690604 RepID=A0ABR0KAU0_9EURO|nr:hypothetical protein LTR24_005189 [Lithohypha guttulata]KAK5318425.1 hypothetical protein LTR70_005447 [Exophiala xenobiotica]